MLAGTHTAFDPTAVDFGTQPLDTLSPTRTVTFANGTQPVHVGRLTLSGAAADDVQVLRDDCAGQLLAAEQKCTAAVRFTPTAAGARTASLGLRCHPAWQHLPGRGAVRNRRVAPARATGRSGTDRRHRRDRPPGRPGHAGQGGARGPRGAAGKVLLVSCREVTVKVRKHGHVHKVRRRRCTTRQARAGVRFVTRGRAKAALLRHGKRVATGIATRRHLTLVSHKRLHAGRYELRLRAHGHTTMRRIAIVRAGR